MMEIRPEGSRYQIERIVGEGLSSIVYKAVRIDSRGFCRQTVALKVLKSGTDVQKLRREFDTLSNLQSSHCVRVIAWENLTEGFAIVLDWIEGATLYELAKFEQLDGDLIAEISSQIQAGLQDLATHRLHHGDLNPKNILIDREGVVRLIDFATLSPRDGRIHGTAAYLAPEVWYRGPLSIEADLFALGLIEADISDQFMSVPDTIESARHRAFEFASAADDAYQRSGRLSPFLTKPELRKTRRVPSCQKKKARLGTVVCCLQEARRSESVSTASLQEPIAWSHDERIVDKDTGAGVRWVARLTTFTVNISSRAARLAFLTAAFLTVGVPVQAVAPLSHEPEGRATLHIRSHQWLRVRLNGKDLGYAPLDVLKLKAGSHRLSWQSPMGEGVVRLQLQDGQQLLLNELDLAHMRRDGNR